MIRNILYLATVGMLTLSSCTKNFEEINSNPNEMTIAPATSLLANTIKNLGYRFGSNEISFPASYTGHIAKRQYNESNRYGVPAPDGHWDALYSSIISNALHSMEEADREENPHIKGAAIVLKSYAYQLLVDAYGPIPYEQSNKIQETTTPTYNTEKEVYLGLIGDLEDAIVLLNESTTKNMGSGDIMFGGDVEMWKKFANSLSLRIATRMMSFDDSETTALAQSKIDYILADQSLVLSSSIENVAVSYPGAEFKWTEPWSTQGVNLFLVGSPIIDSMALKADPRRGKYAHSTSKPGLNIGEEAGSSRKFAKMNTTYIYKNDGTLNYIRFAEVKFLIAEAYSKKGMTTEAATAYEDGIKANMLEFEIDQASIDAYIAQLDVKWDGSETSIKKLYMEKWIMLFHNSWEAWAEMRRTDVPTLPIVDNSFYPNHNRVPFRFNYPANEVILNASNIEKTGVVAEDNYWGYQIAWDTRTGVN